MVWGTPDDRGGLRPHFRGLLRLHMERTPLLIPRQLLLDQRLPSSAKIAYAALASMAPTSTFDWRVDCSLEQVSAISGQDLATVKKAVERLVEVGWVNRSRTGIAAGRYEAAIPKSGNTHRV